MLATEDIDTAHQFLADADREYEAGDILQASEKLWGAASHLAIAEMTERGMTAKGHVVTKRFVRKFGEETNRPELFPLFKAAESLHVNFYHGFLDSDDYLEHRALVHQFVDLMIELTD